MSLRERRSPLKAIVWQINAIRHRDPIDPRRFARLFGAPRRRAWDPARRPKRVVVLRSDEIGDTVTTLTLLAAMRAQWPKARIHLVLKPGPAAIFHAAPTIDRLIRWTPVTEGSAPKRQLLTALQGLRLFGLRGYDLAVLPRWDFDDSPLRYLAVASRARSVVGFDTVPEREPVWFGEQRLLLTDVLARGTEPLLSVQQLERVAGHLGLAWTQPSVPPVGTALFDATDLAAATAATGLGDDEGCMVGVGIGARDSKRQWPIEQIAEALSRLRPPRPLAVQVLGGPEDAERGAALVALLASRGITAVDLCGRLSLSGSAAAISRCELYLGNDSGLQHIASSLELPTVVVTCHPKTGSPWSDNATERFGPWSTRSEVVQPQHPAGDCTEECVAREPHCIRSVSPGEVVGALERVWGAAERRLG